MSSFDIKKLTDNLPAVLNALGRLAVTSTLVGVPEEKGKRDEGDPINNAALAYIHENGSERAGIKPRQFMKPGVEKAENEIKSHLKSASRAAMTGNEGGMTQGFNKAGQATVNSIRGIFTDNKWEPVSVATQKRKGENKTRPLIDTGQLRKSITHVVEEG